MSVKAGTSAASSPSVTPNSARAASNAVSSGANTVKVPGPESVSAKPAASIAAVKLS